MSQNPIKLIRAKFAEFRKTFNAMEHPDALKAFDIISAYFPLVEDVHKTSNDGAIDYVTPHRDGGTFLSNWELTSVQAQIAVDTLKELKCDCFFIVPFPSWKGFPEKAQEQARALCGITLQFHAAAPEFAPPVHFFAVHTFAASQECGVKYAYMSLAKLHESQEFSEAKTPKAVFDAKQETMWLMRKLKKETRE